MRWVSVCGFISIALGKAQKQKNEMKVKEVGESVTKLGNFTWRFFFIIYHTYFASNLNTSHPLVDPS